MNKYIEDIMDDLSCIRRDLIFAEVERIKDVWHDRTGYYFASELEDCNKYFKEINDLLEILNEISN